MNTPCRNTRIAAKPIIAGLLLLVGAAFAQVPDKMPAESPQYGCGGCGGGCGGGQRRRVPPDGMTSQAVAGVAPPAGEGRGCGRMSPEERRQLRRDVHQAGRDIYPERMPPQDGRRW